jgi:23S rRNA pseudouridine1911/1915/1917 synthase
MTKHKQTKPPKIAFETTFTGQSPVTIFDFLKESSPLSGRGLRKYFFKGLVSLNHKKAHSQAMIKPGDQIRVYEMDLEYQTLTPEAIPIEVVFENSDLLVVNKPPLMATHPSGDITSNTLANGVADYLNKTGHTVKVRPVNRLDYGTSGLVIFAKNGLVQTRLSQAIQEHQIARIYYAVVQGIPEHEEGLINLPIGIVNGERVVTEKGQSAETHYRIIQKLTEASLLELTLKTGRTHQIRIHLHQIGHPILGDHQYGVRSRFINRPALHAGKLNFNVPEFKIPELITPLPQDILDLLQALGSM